MNKRLLTIGGLVLVATVWAPTPKVVAWQAAEFPVQAAPPSQTKPAEPNRQTQGQSGNRDSAQQSGLPSPPRGNWLWWKDDKTMQAVKITADQSKQIDDLFHKRLPDARAQDRELRKQEAELNRLLRERTVGADVIAVQLDRVEAQRTTLNKTRTLLLYQVYQVLSAEQYVKLIAYWETQRGGRGDSRK